ncbi:MAG: thiamine-phosphate kinase [Pseudomonadota bacterium]
MTPPGSDRARKIGEFEAIARYFAPLAKDVPGAHSLAEDAASLSLAAAHELVVTTDALVEGVHFLADDPPDLVARKALRVNLSDLAGKGAVPRWYLLDAVLPRRIGEPWIAAFASGLAADQAEFAVVLVGGDMASTPGPLTLAITALGEVPAGRMLRRSGARAGDVIFHSGTIGDGALGLRVRRGELAFLDASARDFLARRYRLPEPRVALGPRLVGVASAALDVSDGLVADLGHICTTSGLGAVIEEARVNLSPAAKAALAYDPEAMASVLGGGDDYEILFTAPAPSKPKLAALAAALGVPMTAIGEMRPGQGVTVLGPDGRRRAVERGGWTHF